MPTNTLLILQAISAAFDYIDRVSKNLGGPDPTKEELDARDRIREAIVAEANQKGN